MEIPPRARGRVTSGHAVRDVHGNTPACAGKSARSRSLPLSCWKYPRVRGEEFTRTFTRAPYSGNTPACAGKRATTFTRAPYSGNTPACAGKRATTLTTARPTRKYPRVRGEEEAGKPDRDTEAEIPPRARGRVISSFAQLENPGNTPACAGKSALVFRLRLSCWKYPRVRGEEGRLPSYRHCLLEIPPRARGRA